VKIAGFAVKRLTIDMAGIIQILAMVPGQPADGFCRVALASVAGAGYVNIVDGRASLSDAGKAIANASDRVVECY
jgi:hypothetical protein